MMVVSRSPFSGVNIMPCMPRPNRNIRATEARIRAPRPLFLSRKCPPPGSAQAAITGIIQAPAGLLSVAVVVSAMHFRAYHGRELPLTPLELFAQHVEEGPVGRGDEHHVEVGD